MDPNIDLLMVEHSDSSSGSDGSEQGSDSSEEFMNLDTHLDLPEHIQENPQFVIITGDAQIVSICERELRNLSPKVEHNFEEECWNSPDVHFVPWLSLPSAEMLKKYIHTRDFKLKGTPKKGKTAQECLRAAKWLGLDCLTQIIFDTVLEDRKKEKPKIFKSTFHAALSLSRFSIEETETQFLELKDLAVNETNLVSAKWVTSEEGLDKSRSEEYGHPMVQATLWEVTARALAKYQSDGSAADKEKEN
ncbi:hypothetical protein TWF694_005764 [Orbilia ellipsospora]|uniref:BTB domain-containing protein n=1 Tax=Orbilia ellipsospora TaxID=2528407 RepID=A0AAV9WRX3_9PEZI